MEATSTPPILYHLGEPRLKAMERLYCAGHQFSPRQPAKTSGQRLRPAAHGRVAGQAAVRRGLNPRLHRGSPSHAPATRSRPRPDAAATRQWPRRTNPTPPCRTAIDAPGATARAASRVALPARRPPRMDRGSHTAGRAGQGTHHGQAGPPPGPQRPGRDAAAHAPQPSRAATRSAPTPEARTTSQHCIMRTRRVGRRRAGCPQARPRPGPRRRAGTQGCASAGSCHPCAPPAP